MIDVGVDSIRANLRVIFEATQVTLGTIKQEQINESGH
jgi:hypothetical protein